MQVMDLKPQNVLRFAGQDQVDPHAETPKAEMGTHTVHLVQNVWWFVVMNLKTQNAESGEFALVRVQGLRFTFDRVSSSGRRDPQPKP